MAISNHFLNPSSIQSIELLSQAEPYLRETLLKQVEIFARFPRYTLHHKADYSTEFHPLPGKEFEKLQNCYQRALQMAVKNSESAPLCDLEIKMVYVNHLEQETAVTLTPEGITIDMTYLNPLKDK